LIQDITGNVTIVVIKWNVMDERSAEKVGKTKENIRV
jgi:hypothetical protein